MAGHGQAHLGGLRSPVGGAAVRRSLGGPLRAGRSDQRGLGGSNLVAQALHEVLGRQRLAAIRRGAELHAPPALGASEGVEEVAPGQVSDGRSTEGRSPAGRRLGLEIHLAQRSPRLQVAEVDVGLAGEDVEVLAVGQVRQEGEDRQDVGPGEDCEAPGRDIGSEQLEDQAERAGDHGHDPGRVVRLKDVPNASAKASDTTTRPIRPRITNASRLRARRAGRMTMRRKAE